MHYWQRVPRAPLDVFVESIWVYETEPGPRALERILPTGKAQLIVNLKEDQIRGYDSEPPYRCTTTSGTVLVGVRSRYQIIDTAEQEYVAGVVFKPAGTVPFIRVPAHETSDADVPMEALWGRSQANALREQLLEAEGAHGRLDVIESALRRAFSARSLHPAVAFALTAFDRVPLTTSVAAVSDGVGMSAKRFIDCFKREVGVTPKRYCRIRRFQQAVTRANAGLEIDWSRVALDSGYFDQAHFIHDFRSFTGVTPTGYQAGRTAFQNHVKFLQSDDGAS